MIASDQDKQPRGGARDRLQAHYDQLWSETIGRIRSGNIELDPVLQVRMPDQRRGLTVISRPPPTIRQRLAVFLEEMRTIEPDQYYYDASEFHLTVLSLFTATVDHTPFLARLKHYVSAVDRALRKAAPFRIEFKGVTASPAAVMIQGFFETDALNELRDGLRRELRAAGLGEGLDRRYWLYGAHTTVARFQAPLRDRERFAGFLAQARERSFGATTVRDVRLVENDWYMSRQHTRTLKRYCLICRT